MDDSEHRRSKYYKVRGNVYQLVKMRAFWSREGFAYVHKRDKVIVMTEFRAEVSKNLGLAAKSGTRLSGGERARLVR